MNSFTTIEQLEFSVLYIVQVMYITFYIANTCERVELSSKMFISPFADSTDFGVSVPNSQALIQMVRKAVLTETEITLLVETIQGKQGATPSQWTKVSRYDTFPTF